MGTLLQFALETALLNSISWMAGSLISVFLIGPAMLREGYKPSARWFAYSVVAACAGAASYLYFDGSTGGAAGAAIAWLAIFLVAGAFIAATMAVSTLVLRK